MDKLVKTYTAERETYYGTYEGKFLTEGKRGVRERIRLSNLVDDYGNFITNYTWFNDLKCFSELNLQIGDRVSFRARLNEYQAQIPDIRYGTGIDDEDRFFYINKVEKISSSTNIYEPCKIKITPTKKGGYNGLY